VSIQTDLSTHEADTTNIHGIADTSALVTLTGTQTLTNKTLTSPTFTGTVTLPSSTSIGSVSSTELGYLDGASSSIQTQLNAKASTGKAIAMAIVFGG
jgi:hypothetical protein